MIFPWPNDTAEMTAEREWLSAEDQRMIEARTAWHERRRALIAKRYAILTEALVAYDRDYLRTLLRQAIAKEEADPQSGHFGSRVDGGVVSPAVQFQYNRRKGVPHGWANIDIAYPEHDTKEFHDLVAARSQIGTDFMAMVAEELGQIITDWNDHTCMHFKRERIA